MPIEKTCTNCSVKFWVKPKDHARKFCKLLCMRSYETINGREAAHVVSTKFECKQCGKHFFVKPAEVRAYRKKFGKDRVYCSRACAWQGKILPESAWQVSCIQCKKPMPIQRKPGGTVNRQKRLCSTECRALFRRLSYQQHNSDQQITKRIARHGYIRMIIPGTNGQSSRDVFEHRYVMSKHLGRELLSEETVHHKDGNRQHNALENLELFSSRHGPGQRVTDKVTFAIDMLRTYPEFARAAGYELREVAHDSLPPSAGMLANIA